VTASTKIRTWYGNRTADLHLGGRIFVDRFVIRYTNSPVDREGIRRRENVTCTEAGVPTPALTNRAIAIALLSS
jgi:hypothetical protein